MAQRTLVWGRIALDWMAQGKSALCRLAQGRLEQSKLVWCRLAQDKTALGMMVWLGRLAWGKRALGRLVLGSKFWISGLGVRWFVFRLFSFSVVFDIGNESLSVSCVANDLSSAIRKHDPV